MALLEDVLDIWQTIDMKTVRKEAQNLTNLFIETVETLGLNLKLVSPVEANRRGSQISFEANHAYEKAQALIKENIVGDFRNPNIIRFGFNPLFNNEHDTIIAAKKLALILDKKCWHNYLHVNRKTVT